PDLSAIAMAKREVRERGRYRGRSSKPGTRLAASSGRGGSISGAVEIQLAAQDMGQGLDRQFHEQKRLGDEIVAATQGGTGAALEIRQSGHKQRRRFGLRRQ